MKTAWVIGILSLGVLTGCDLLVKPSADGGAGGGTTSSDLQGTWSGRCSALASSSSQGAVIAGATAMFFNQTTFTDVSCVTASSILASRYLWTGGSQVSTPVGAKTLDLTKDVVLLTPKTSATVTSFNSGSMCGLTGWTIDVPQPVTGTTCDGGVSALYTVYQISGSTMYLGKGDSSHDGSTLTKRHAAVDSSSPYTK